jgi:hypothetical protein
MALVMFADAMSTLGSVILTELFAIHPLASVTIMLNVPGDKFVIPGVDGPFDHAYRYGAVPPFPITLAVPFADPLQVTLVDDTEVDKRFG